MSKLTNFLEELNDQELVSFYHFRYEQFIKHSKEKIDQEIDFRGLDRSNLVLNVEGNLQEDLCSRCGSSKFYTSNEIETITYSYASLDLNMNYKTCLVCLYCEEKESGESGHRFVGMFSFVKALFSR